MRMPTLFVSHGAPLLAISQTPASEFFRSLAGKLPRPKAVLMVSAHWEERVASVGLGTETIHDFYGFPQALYQIQYPAPVARDAAARAVALLEAAGIKAASDAGRGRDHGAWVPMALTWPALEMPVAQLSLIAGGSPVEHFAIGQALAPLRDEGVLIMGSGSATHNLRARPTPAPAEWATGFIDWLDRTLEAGDDAALKDWQRAAPYAAINHPSAEHFDPIFVARGAAAGERVTRLHHSWEFGSLSMNAYAFGL